MAIGLLLCPALTGCGWLGFGPTAEVRALREKFVVDQEPAGAVAIAEARQATDRTRPVVIAGRIGVPDQEPWLKGQAGFVVRDASDEEASGHGGHDHDPETCPFCKRRAAQPDAIAVVRFLDEQGRPIPRDARELFDLALHQRVVVSGAAELDENEMLVITARSFYVDRR